MFNNEEEKIIENTIIVLTTLFILTLLSIAIW